MNYSAMQSNTGSPQIKEDAMVQVKMLAFQWNLPIVGGGVEFSLLEKSFMK